MFLSLIFLFTFFEWLSVTQFDWSQCQLMSVDNIRYEGDLIWCLHSYYEGHNNSPLPPPRKIEPSRFSDSYPRKMQNLPSAVYKIYQTFSPPVNGESFMYLLKVFE